MENKINLKKYKRVFINGISIDPKTIELLGYQDIVNKYFSSNHLICGWQYISLDKNNISEICEYKNVDLKIPYELLDEFLCFSRKGRIVLFEKTQKRSSPPIVKISFSKVVMKTNYSYLILTS